MTDRPMRFSAPMVRALLDGRKTQTRRVLKPQPVGPMRPLISFNHGRKEIAFGPDNKARDGGPRWWRLLEEGDRLWVREAHALLPHSAYRASIGTGTIDQREHPTDGYSAAVFREGFDRSGRPRWRPSIHMPRWASRLTLTVTEVRVERLQDISEADARAEGCPFTHDGRQYDPPPPDVDSWQGYGRASFCLLWSKINGAGSWEANPWVMAVSFNVERANIDSLPKVAA